MGQKNNICFSDEKKWNTPNVYKFDVYDFDVNGQKCRATREEVITTGGYKYSVYNEESHNNNLCEVVPNNNASRGTVLFAGFNILFDESVSLHAKGYNENEKAFEVEKVSGTHYIPISNAKNLKLKLEMDKTILKNNGISWTDVEVSIVGDEEILNSVGENLIYFALESAGRGKIAGVDNGDQATIDKFQQESVIFKRRLCALIKAYRDKALVIICSKVIKSTNTIGKNIDVFGATAVLIVGDKERITKMSLAFWASS